ncbi:MAG: enoyl-CoA hydratase-related protein [Alphaproteobacteria bacterium]|jgi:enoyl-CoA hydratase
MGQIRTKIDGHIAWLLFDRPDKLNAMTIDSWREMGEALTALGKESEVRVLILAGEGRAFLAGHDVNEMREHSRAFAAGTYKPADLHEGQKMLQETTRLIRKLRFPVIAAVHGFAVGAGCEVTVACDLVVAAEGAKFGFPEVNVGVTITNGGTFLLPRKIGLARAREMAYTGEFIDAEEALAMGLVNRVVPEDRLRDEAEALARRIASRAPMAVQLHKTMIDRGLEATLETMLAFETEALVMTAVTDDHIEGVNAFFEKREPDFKGV